MKIAAVIREASPVRVWGLTPADRIRRFSSRRGISESVSGEVPAGTESVVVVRGDHVFDDWVLEGVVARSPVALRRGAGPGDPIVAAHVPAGRVQEALSWFGPANPGPAADVPALSPKELVAGVRLGLRKVREVFVLEVRPENRHAIERYLFTCSYKGVTDFVTKWIWPVPARWTVQACVRLGLKPNHVTSLGFLLMMAALWLFSAGRFGPGLAAGWLMTFLDTVDGKLARTTLSSSRFGHYLDKVTDIVHPPFWYLAWAGGLQSYASPTPGIPLEGLVAGIFGFYLLGRLAEAVGSRVLVAGGIFVWRPVDSYFRLITARRNTCLPLLTAGAAAGRPDLGLWMVGVWTAATTLFLLVRLAAAWTVWRRGTGKLTSWLTGVDVAAKDAPLAVRVFVQRSTAAP